MEDSVGKSLDMVLRELLVLKQQQKDLLSACQNHRSLIEAGPTMGQFATRFCVPDATGLSVEKAVQQFVDCACSQMGTLPEETKTILNPYQMQAGDLILMRPKKPDTLSVYGRIKWSQTVEIQRKLSGIYDKACFTHLVISGGYHEIYESLPDNGILRTAFWRYMNDNYEITVKRLKGLSASVRHQIASCFSSLLGDTSNFVDLPTIKSLSQQLPWLRHDRVNLIDESICTCSALFVAACSASDIDLDLPSYGNEGVVATPASLNLSNALEEVDVARVAIT